MPYQVHKANLATDGTEILDFFQRNFPDWPAGKFQWFYRDNVYGPADCWLVRETGSGVVVGSSAIFPRRVYLDGRRLLAGVAGDLGIDRRHRILGPALMLLKAVAEAGRSGKYDFLYGLPNQRSEPVAKLAGFRTVGPSIRLVRAIRTDAHLAKLLRVPLLPRIAGLAANCGLRLFARESRFRLDSGYRTEILEQTDKRFNELWIAARKNHRLIGERDHRFLDWRFAACPFRQYRVFAVCRDADSTLAGYVVYHQNGNTLHIADMLTSAPHLLEEAVLPAFLRFARNNRRDSVSIAVLGGVDVLGALGKYHFHQRGIQGNHIMLTGMREDLIQAVHDPSNCFWLGADFDV